MATWESKSAISDGSCSAPKETRTPVLALKGPRANRYTMGASSFFKRADFTIPLPDGQAESAVYSRVALIRSASNP